MQKIILDEVVNNLINSLDALSEACQIIREDDFIISKYKSWVNIIKKCIKNGNTIFFCGNGGSFSDAQHLVTELVVRYEVNRDPINAICLGSNQTNLTAIGNDFTFEDIFVRELSALYRKGDLVFILSTSGNSKNIVKVAKFLHSKGEKAIALLGNDGGIVKDISDSIVLPLYKTSLIQEIQILIGHSICHEIEQMYI